MIWLKEILLHPVFSLFSGLRALFQFLVRDGGSETVSGRFADFIYSLVQYQI